MMAFSTDLKTAGKIAEHIGMPATMMLVGWYGGRTVYVPTTTNDENHILRKITGDEPITALVEKYPGEYLAIPEVDISALRQAGLVHRLTAKGVSAEDIAQIAGICPRTVRVIRKQLRLEGFPEIADLLPPDSEETP